MDTPVPHTNFDPLQLLLLLENQRTGEVHHSDDSCYIAVTTPATSQQQSKTLKQLTILLQ